MNDTEWEFPSGSKIIFQGIDWAKGESYTAEFAFIYDEEYDAWIQMPYIDSGDTKIEEPE